MTKHISIGLCSALVMGLVIQLAWAVTGDPLKGKAIYERSCITCHGAQGKGDGPASKMLTPPPADLTSPKTQGKLDKDLLYIIENGRPPSAMPAFLMSLSEQEIYDVFSYIRTFGK